VLITELVLSANLNRIAKSIPTSQYQSVYSTNMLSHGGEIFKTQIENSFSLHHFKQNKDNIENRNTFWFIICGNQRKKPHKKGLGIPKIHLGLNSNSNTIFYCR